MAEPENDNVVDDVAAQPSCPPKVRDALRAQASPELVKEARRYARGRVDYLRQIGQRVDTLYHQDLVQEVLADLWQGTLRWDPEEKPLLDRVVDVIKQRTSNEARRARRFPHVSLEDRTSDGCARVYDDTPAHASRGDLNPILVAAVVDEIVGELRRMAARDRDACAILSCWERGITERVEVLARTGLSPTAYHNARRRILRLAENLPPHLRQAAREILRSAS